MSQGPVERWGGPWGNAEREEVSEAEPKDRALPEPGWLQGHRLLEMGTWRDPPCRPRQPQFPPQPRRGVGGGCPLPSPDAQRGLGASRSPQGNICTFQTRVVSSGDGRQAPAHTPPYSAGRHAGNKAGERALEERPARYVTAWRASSHLPRRARTPPPPPPHPLCGSPRAPGKQGPPPHPLGSQAQAEGARGHRPAPGPWDPAGRSRPGAPTRRGGNGSLWQRDGVGQSESGNLALSSCISIYGEQGWLPGPEMMFKLMNSSFGERADLKKNTQRVRGRRGARGAWLELPTPIWLLTRPGDQRGGVQASNRGEAAGAPGIRLGRQTGGASSPGHVEGLPAGRGQPAAQLSAGRGPGVQCGAAHLGRP